MLKQSYLELLFSRYLFPVLPEDSKYCNEEFQGLKGIIFCLNDPPEVMFICHWS